MVNMRVTRLADVAGPISTQERIGTTPQLPSLVTNTEMVVAECTIGFTAVEIIIMLIKFW